MRRAITLTIAKKKNNCNNNNHNGKEMQLYALQYFK